MSRGYHPGENLYLAMCTTTISQLKALLRPAALCFWNKNSSENHFLLFAFEKWIINSWFVLHVYSYFLNISLRYKN